ncbi:MAG TPA: MerR family transcriptional regulator [Streptosporangiaceae bacterium]|nr:MerR family transcriptional regulator [Streptosporangiaceae bacterium]
MSAQPARAYLGIGEVLALLRGEFPDISVSKIRFLESEGLIEPARTPSKYRKFDAADVERLRYILTAQRDEYLPLRVIKERLLPPAAGSGGGGNSADGGDNASAAGPLTRRQLLDAAGLDEGQLAELETFGLIRRTGRVYGPDAQQVASAAAVLAGYGVEARHLRTVRAAVEREISFIEQVVAPILRQRNPEARQQAGRTAREIAAVTMRLHGALIESALGEAGLAGARRPLARYEGPGGGASA